MKTTTAASFFVALSIVLLSVSAPPLFAAQERLNGEAREALTADLRLQDGDSRTVTLPIRAGEVLEVQAFMRFENVAGYTQAVRVFLNGVEMDTALDREENFEISDGREVRNFLHYRGGWTVPLTPSLASFQYAPGRYEPADASFDPSKIRFKIRKDYPEGAKIKVVAKYDPETFDELVVTSIRAVASPEDSR